MARTALGRIDSLRTLNYRVQPLAYARVAIWDKKYCGWYAFRSADVDALLDGADYYEWFAVTPHEFLAPYIAWRPNVGE